MRAPLSVRIDDGVRANQVTRYVRGFRFTKTAPGGFHSASVSIDAPEGLLGELGAADRVFIYDGRTARPLWDGYIENPGRSRVLGGDRFDIAAMGGVVVTADNARAVVFRSRDMSSAQWTKYESSLEPATAEADGGVIRTAFSPGMPVGSGDHSLIVGRALANTGQTLLTVSALARAGKVDVAYDLLLAAGDNAATSSAGSVLAFTTTPTAMSFTPGALGFVPQTVLLGIQRTGGAASVADNDTSGIFNNLIITPQLLTATGADATPVDVSTVLAHEVVAHVLGDMLPLIDGTRATIETTTFAIDNLAYFGGAKPQQILDDLTFYEPDFLWEVLESNAAGRFRFAFRAWPTTPRYEISGRTYTESGGEAELSNRIAVTWTDTSGVERTTVRDAFVRALGDRVRDADPITLPEGQGSQANAERIGDEVLASLNGSTRAGTATVSEPIYDRLSGRTVMPWEIEPGHLVRVRNRGIDLRLTEMTYDDANCTTSLTLGSPTLSIAQRIARLGAR